MGPLVLGPAMIGVFPGFRGAYSVAPGCDAEKIRISGAPWCFSEVLWPAGPIDSLATIAGEAGVGRTPASARRPDPNDHRQQRRITSR